VVIDADDPWQFAWAWPFAWARVVARDCLRHVASCCRSYASTFTAAPLSTGLSGARVRWRRRGGFVAVTGAVTNAYAHCQRDKLGARLCHCRHRQHRLYARHRQVDHRVDLEAALAALADAGLDPGDVDAVLPSTNAGRIAEEFIANLGLRDVAFAPTAHMGRASLMAAVKNACLAIHAGVASCVLVVAGRCGYSGERVSAGLHVIEPIMSSRGFGSCGGASSRSGKSPTAQTW
jgi:hypothetical protein